MACKELDRLRADARQLYHQLGDKIRLSQGFRLADDHTGKTDYEAFLRHQLAQAEAQIRRHLERHGCDAERIS